MRNAASANGPWSWTFFYHTLDKPFWLDVGNNSLSHISVPAHAGRIGHALPIDVGATLRACSVREHAQEVEYAIADA